MDNAKLSKLHIFILVEACKHGEIQNADALIRWYGFEPAYSYRGIKFVRRRISLRRYLSDTASTAKTLTRLRDRGLMRRKDFAWGHVLASAGRAVVHQMDTANFGSP